MRAVSTSRYGRILVDLNYSLVHFSCRFVYLPKYKSVEHTVAPVQAFQLRYRTLTSDGEQEEWNIPFSVKTGNVAPVLNE